MKQRALQLSSSSSAFLPWRPLTRPWKSRPDSIPSCAKASRVVRSRLTAASTALGSYVISPVLPQPFWLKVSKPISARRFNASIASIWTIAIGQLLGFNRPQTRGRARSGCPHCGGVNIVSAPTHDIATLFVDDPAPMALIIRLERHDTKSARSHRAMIGARWI